jgi:predicted nucleic acid-binding protein
MSARPLLDTDVMIDYLRRVPEAIAFVRGLPARPVISAVTVGELYSGVREGTERAALEAILVAFRVLPVTRQVAIRGGLFRRQYRASHGVQLADALIAATAEISGAELKTCNLKHYPMFPTLAAAYVKP